jgi:hypothetical protein
MQVAEMAWVRISAACTGARAAMDMPAKSRIDFLCIDSSKEWVLKRYRVINPAKLLADCEQ